MRRYDYDYGWKPYVPVAERRRQAAREAARLAKKGRTVSPVVIEGKKIAQTFWGKAWCDNLERYSDYSNRLPRGRTYLRNGSVGGLQIAAGGALAGAILEGRHGAHLPGEDRAVPCSRGDRALVQLPGLGIDVQARGGG